MTSLRFIPSTLYVIAGLVGCCFITLIAFQLFKEPVSQNERNVIKFVTPPLVEDEEISRVFEVSAAEGNGILDRLNSAEDIEVLCQLLKHYLSDHEDMALDFLSDVDLEIADQFMVVEVLVDYYSEFPHVIDSILSLEALKETRANLIFTEVASRLLQDSSSGESPQRVLNYIAEPSNYAVAVRAVPQVGWQLTKGKDNPREVIDQIDQLKQLTNKESLLQGALDQWYWEDRDAVFAYLNEMPNRPAHDIVALKIVHEFQSEDPIVAMTWADAIENPESRNHAIRGAAFHLARLDMPSYLVWLETVKNAALKESIINSITLPDAL